MHNAGSRSCVRPSKAATIIFHPEIKLEFWAVLSDV